MVIHSYTDSDSRFLMQVSESLSVPPLIVFLGFFNCFCCVNCFACDLFNFIARACFNHFARVNCFAQDSILLLAFVSFVSLSSTVFLAFILLFASLLSKLS